MKLQLALDAFSLMEAVQILKLVNDHIDIIEVGTPLALREGIHAIQRIKVMFPSKEVLADFKIMDGGKLEARMAFDAGADVVTVLGVAFNATIEAVVREARISGRRVMADMIGVKKLRERARELVRMGVDYICVHTAFDIQDQGHNPLHQLQALKGIIEPNKLAAAGGIQLNMIDAIISEAPHIVVVGQGIVGASDPVKAAYDIKTKIPK